MNFSELNGLKNICAKGASRIFKVTGDSKGVKENVWSAWRNSTAF
jgi:hypothetical protein